MARTLLLAALVATAVASYDGSGDVVVLSTASFNSAVVEDSATWLVEFYAPWCGHCKRLEPIWKETATKGKATGVKVGAVDCTIERDICSKYEVRGYPTIKVFGSDKSSPKPHNGPRDVDAFLSTAANAN